LTLIIVAFGIYSKFALWPTLDIFPLRDGYIIYLLLLLIYYYWVDIIIFPGSVKNIKNYLLIQTIAQNMSVNYSESNKHSTQTTLAFTVKSRYEVLTVQQW